MSTRFLRKEKTKKMNEIKTLELDKIRMLLSECCISEPAKKRALTLLPFDTSERCKTSLEETDEAYILYKKYSAPTFSGLSDISETLKKADRGAVLSAGELLKIARVLRVTRLLEEYLKNHISDGALLKYLPKFMSNKYLEEKIFTDFPSEEEVSDTASSQLRDIRRKILQAKNKIRSSLETYIKSPNYQKYLQDNIITIRNDRFVIPVKTENKNEIPGLVHDTSASGSTVFIEPMSAVSANNELSVLAAEEKREIEKILAELSQEIKDFSSGINQGYFLSVYFDFLFAKAKFADKTNASKPIINENGIINLLNARHPLIDKNKVVPTNILLGEKYSVLMVTGPNTGGKTVTLKTTGLLCLMAKCGLFIPAKEGSKVAFFDKIFADIGDEQSIEQSLSTFSSHMSNIIKILDNADENSLVLLDELGSGTDPAEGAALAIAIIKKLMSKNAKIAATTHYPELKIFAIHTPDIENASCEFDLATLKPTYRLLIGMPGKSNAFEIASKLGMPIEVISEAKEQISSETVKLENVLADLELSRKEIKNNEKIAAQKLYDAEEYCKKLIKDAEKMKSDAEAEAEKSRKKALDLWEKTVNESEFIIDELENVRKEKDKKDFKEKLQKAKNDYEVKSKFAEKLNKINKKPIERELVKGDTVKIISLDKEATVISPADKKGYIELQAGIIKTKIKISDLELIDKPKIKTQISVTSVKTERGSRNVSNEVDIRGENVLDAESIVDDFLHNCYLSGLKTVSIIHGKGTGVLRQGVHSMLKKNPLVESFRLGTFGEGESGVTIVTLK